MNKDPQTGYPADSAHTEQHYNYPEVILNSALNPTERIVLASYYTLILTLCWWARIKECLIVYYLSIGESWKTRKFIL